MRRFSSLSLGFLILAGCGEASDSSIVEVLSEEDPSLPTTSQIFDGASGESGANPHFFFFPPIADNSPDYSGVADDSLEPTVTVCHFADWNAATETCDATPLATFTMEPDAFGNTISVTEGVKYHVVWKTNDYPVESGQVFRIAVSVVDRVLGWADVAAYDQQTYNSFQHTDQDGNVAISDNGNLNINFRIEDGALEHEWCDGTGFEDCDVALFTVEESGCLRVFENPGLGGELLGSQACVPANAAELDGEPVEGTFAVILTLEEADVFQGGTVPMGLQVPYFPDLKTDPPGISFTPTSDGVGVVICQVESGLASIPEELHPQLRPFLVYSDGTTVLPEEYSFGAPECEDLGSHGETFASGHAGEGSILGRLASGFSKVSSFFLPKPLVARRLHGGLNTTVYDTKGDDGPGGEAVSAFATGDEEFVVELGAILNVDPLNSTASVPATGQVGAESSITINALNAQGLPFPFEVPVTVDVISGTGEVVGTVSAVSHDGDGVYTATYAPTTVGTDLITIFIDGEEMAGSPFSSNIAPRNIDATGSTFDVSYSEEGSPTTVTVTVIDTEGDPYTYQADFPVDVEISVTGANTATETATDPEGDGTYVASYTPENYGDDEITVTINDDPTGDSPTTVTTAPRPVDPSGSTATLVSTADVPSGGQVEAQTDITIMVVNEAGEPYDYADTRPIDVQVSVTGANTVAPFAATDANGDGTYNAAYTPAFPGTDQVSVTIDGTPIFGSPFESVVAPLSGDINVTVDISGPGVAPEDGLPVNLYSGATLVETATTNASGIATFVDKPFGSYTVYLPKRDFDAEFAVIEQTLEHQTAPSSVTFTGYTKAIPTGVEVYRIRSGGNGNAFQYVLDNRSWTSAQNQIRGDVLLGVPAHLADILYPGENDFVTSLVASKCPNLTNEKRCKYQGWIGLSDEESEGNFQWVTGEGQLVTGEGLVYVNWKEGEPSGKNNEDHVEINLFGFWTDENGASSTNEGYVKEHDAAQPPEHPTF